MAASYTTSRDAILSRRLRDMEIELGAELFERTNAGTRLTPAGRDFLASANSILRQVDNAIRRLRSRSRGENGHLTIGVYASPSAGNMYATLIDHRHRYPDVEVFTFDGDRQQLLCALESHAVDIAIMTANIPRRTEQFLPLWSERVILAVHRQHRLAQRSAVYWSDLATEQILVSRNGPGQELESLLLSRLSAKASKHLLHQESGLDRLLSLVSAEFGALLMLEGATGVHFDDVVYREVHDSDGPTRLRFSAFWAPCNQNPTLSPFVAMLRQRYPDLSARRPSAHDDTPA